jgi:hypothetical protein
MSSSSSARSASRKPKRQRWCRAKSHTAKESDDDECDEGIEMQELVKKTEELWQPVRSSMGAYDMDKPQDKLALAADLWRGGYFDSIETLRNENPVLVELLDALITNTTTPKADKVEQFEEGKARLVNGILVSIVRAQSQKKMPLLSAAIGIVGMCNGITREFHDTIASFSKGFTPSDKWLEDFVNLAMTVRPEPEPEEMIDGVYGCVFDNLQVQMDYHSFMVDGIGGQQLKMTTWMSCHIPRSLAPNLDLDAYCTLRRPPARQ